MKKQWLTKAAVNQKLLTKKQLRQTRLGGNLTSNIVPDL